MIQLEKPSECAEGERCYCGSPAWTKVEEVIFFDDPSWDDMTNTCFGRHPLHGLHLQGALQSDHGNQRWRRNLKQKC